MVKFTRLNFKKSKEIRNILLFFLFIFSVKIAFSQIRLDSIIVVNQATQEATNTFRFEYEVGLTSYYERTSLYNGNIAIEIERNANGDFKKWTFLNYDGIEQYFIYDSNMQLDSIKSAGYVYYFTYQDDLLVEMVLTGGGEYILSREYYYQDELLDSIAFFFPYYEDPYIGSSTFHYDSEGRLVEIHSFEHLNTLVEKWIASFEDEQIVDLSLFNYYNYPTGNKEFSYKYKHKSDLPFSGIQNPQDLIEKLEFLFFLDLGYPKYPQLQIPFQYSSQVSDIELQYSGEVFETYFYYYSTTLGTEDERMVMTPISISPNPTTDYINLKVEGEIESISVISIHGKLISRQASTNKQMNVQSLINGHYFAIVALSNGTNVFGKFIKQ